MLIPDGQTNSPLCNVQEIEVSCGCLRHKLQKITESGISTHIESIKNLALQYNHQIMLIRDDSVACVDIEYNCFMYALGVADSDEIKQILNNDWDAKVGTDFVIYLIQNGVIVPQEAGNLIIYFSSNLPKHAGIVIGDRVRSKWGVGHMWEHGIFEVPSAYGNEFGFYAIYDSSAVVEHFKQWHALKTAS